MQAVQALRQAVKPLLLVGGGAHISGAAAQVAELARRLQMAVVTSLSGKEIMAEDDPMVFGVTGSMGVPPANEMVRQADLIFFIGCKGGQLATFGYDYPLPGTTVIHLDIDPEEIDRNYPGSIALVADVRTGLETILDAWGSGTTDYRWDLAMEKERSRHWYEQATRQERTPGTPLAPQAIMQVIDGFITGEDLVVCDASLACGWAAVYLRLRTAGRNYLAPRGLAGLGWGAPAAIGAALSAPGRRILHFAGDGGFAYSVQELEVMSRLQLPVVTILFNNDTLGWIKYIQQKRYQERYISCDFSHIDFMTVARGFGLRSHCIRNLDQLADILATEHTPEGPVLLDVISDPWESPVLRNVSGSA